MASPIIPKQAAPLRALTVTMAVMCYLACLAIGALFLVNRAVTTWTNGLTGEVTVQVRETRGDEMDAKLKKAEEIITAAPGINSVEVLDRDAGIKLLEPWLGQSDLADLPVPRLIRVRIDPQAGTDFGALSASLSQAVPGATVDTHERWVDQLTDMARSLSRLSMLVLSLIILSAIAMVIFATRAALSANRQIVDVLRLVGASNGFIARQIDRRFIGSGLFAGLIGTALGLVTFLVLGLSRTSAVADAALDIVNLPSSTNWQLYASLVLLPVVATLIALVTSRLTLIRMLNNS
jgi:cell division transport system permease protein